MITSLGGCGFLPPGAVGGARATSATSKPRTITGTVLYQQVNAAARAKGSVHVVVGQSGTDYGTAPQRVNGDIAWTGHGLRMQFTIDDAGRRLSVVAADDAVYLKGIPKTPRDRPWLKVSRTGTDTLSRALRPQLDQLFGSGDILGVTQSVSGLTFTDTGNSTMPGTRQLTTRLTTQQWLLTVAADRREQARTWARDRGVTGERVMVFLDQEGLPVKEIRAVEPSTAQLTYQTDYSNWGVPVDIQVPPESQVFQGQQATA